MQHEAVNDHVSIFYLCGYVTSLPRHNTYTGVSSAFETVASDVQGCILFTVTGQGYANGMNQK